MAAYNSHMLARGPFAPGPASAVAVPCAPPGTFMPGTKVQVGNHRVIIDRYLSEGGFAHVYVVTLPKPIDGQEKGVLKRVAVPDKTHLANMRTEVDTMKRLRGHKYIVKYIDSHASSLKSGGYEVFLLMEYCQGGGLIDFMNTRLQNRLTEPEILNIFTDIAEGVACMHYLKPPLLHRDLKIENVLISTSGKNRIYKLCDFGSAAPPRPPATSTAEGRLIEEDIQQHTTLQYRSPEMIDVYRKQPIDEKSDIWALGCFLYKLCYYTTPFEDVGQMAILNASFKYPGYPKFSDQLKLLIATMLREQPSQRPNIYQVLQQSCKMDGRELSIRDIYSTRTESQRPRTETLPDPKPAMSGAGATLAPPKPEAAQSIPDVAPMRRGRPSAPTSHHNSAKPSPSPLRMIESSDPFAQLDGNKLIAGDELASKFPTLDQFALITDKSSNFAFQSEAPLNDSSRDETISQRVTNALADEAFATLPDSAKKKPDVVPKTDITRAATVAARPKAPLADIASISIRAPAHSVPRKPVITSAGAITNPPSSSISMPPVSDKPIWRVPNAERSSSTGQIVESNGSSEPVAANRPSGSRLANLLQQDALKSQDSSRQASAPPTSSSQFMEDGRSACADLNAEPLTRSRSLNVRKRPVSVNIGAGPTHIRDRELKKSDLGNTVLNSDFSQPEPAMADAENHIASDMDFLKVKEEEEKERSKYARRGSNKSGHGKRASLPSIALAGTKSILHGRFGEAFKKFEGSDDQYREEAVSFEEPTSLPPIAGSETADLSEDGSRLDETEELSPEMKRELEKRQLEAEEKRVACAATEYRQRAAAGAGRPPVPSGKAASIQNRVQSLLQESGRPVQKTATGYGQYTEAPQPHLDPVTEPAYRPQNQSSALPHRAKTVSAAHQENRSISAPASQVNLQRLQRPSAPPKPKVLQFNHVRTMPANMSFDVAVPPISGADDWEDQFSKRYPSLSHLEMVETDIEDRSQGPKLSIKEV